MLILFMDYKDKFRLTEPQVMYNDHESSFSSCTSTLPLLALCPRNVV